MEKDSRTENNPSFFDRFLDGFVDSLRISGSSDLFLGIFVILEGLCLIFAPSLFIVCIIIGTSATTIIDGIKNLIDANRYGKRLFPRIFFSILSLIYINYGVIYLFIGGGNPTSFFTTWMHGIVFIFLGLTDLWFYYFVSKTRRQ